MIELMPPFAMDKPLKKRGQPRKEPPANALEVIKNAAAKGASRRGVAIALQVHDTVVQRWLEEYPELREAFEQGREVERADLHRVLYDCAISGQGKDSLIAAMFLLKARHGYIEGDKATESNRVSINFQIPGAMPLSQFQVIENEPNNRAEPLPTKFVGRA